MEIPTDGPSIRQSNLNFSNFIFDLHDQCTFIEYFRFATTITDFMELLRFEVSKTLIQKRNCNLCEWVWITMILYCKHAVFFLLHFFISHDLILGVRAWWYWHMFVCLSHKSQNILNLHAKPKKKLIKKYHEIVIMNAILDRSSL